MNDPNPDYMAPTAGASHVEVFETGRCATLLRELGLPVLPVPPDPERSGRRRALVPRWAYEVFLVAPDGLESGALQALLAAPGGAEAVEAVVGVRSVFGHGDATLRAFLQSLGVVTFGG